jgi:hypothetical protein
MEGFLGDKNVTRTGARPSPVVAPLPEAGIAKVAARLGFVVGAEAGSRPRVTSAATFLTLALMPAAPLVPLLLS